MFKQLISILAGSFRHQTKAAVHDAIMAGAVEGVEEAFAKLNGEPVPLGPDATTYLEAQSTPESTQVKTTTGAARNRKRST